MNSLEQNLLEVPNRVRVLFNNSRTLIHEALLNMLMRLDVSIEILN